MICQGFKPDPGNLAVRHYRGASRNVRHGETVNPSCNRKSRNGNPSPKVWRARFLSQPHAAFDVAGTGNVAWSRCCDTSQPKGRGNREHKLRPKPARQSPTLLLEGTVETSASFEARSAPRSYSTIADSCTAANNDSAG